MLTKFKNIIFDIDSDEEFNRIALEMFIYQFENNNVYKTYTDLIGCDISQINHFTQIPFLPIEFFKTHKIITGNAFIQASFGSSGTTGSARSFHHVTDMDIYEKSAILSFERYYGSLSEYTILALLPSYTERQDSSLVWMTNLFISKSSFKQDCGFYLGNHSELLNKLKILSSDASRKVLLLGVSFALLDLSEEIDFPLNKVIVMETGGMKGRRKEMIREELHEILMKKFQVASIHSEYGMTELLSQAYSQGNGVFRCSPWMRVLTRETNDPLSITSAGRSGGINMIDLANMNSCAFIATQDTGKCYDDGTFEITGRFDYAETRGCNLMVT